MILAILGFLDIIAGVCLLFPNFFGFYMGIIMLLKGLSSMTSIPSGDIGILVMGIIDISAGAILLLNFSIPWLWLILLIKGIYSLIIGLGNR